MNNIYLISCCLILSSLITACGGGGSATTEPTLSEKVYPDFTDVTALGGDTTSFDTANSGHGFSTPAVNLTPEQLELHLEGDANFETSFTTAPNQDHPELDGLGPVFNNADCNSCHQRDGRNSTLFPPQGQTRLKLGSDAGIFLRISQAINTLCTKQTPANNYCAPQAVSGFGTQLFHRGVLRARNDWRDNPFIGQADVYLSWIYSEFTYPDGTKVRLKKPIFEIENPYDAPGETKMSANVTSAVLQDDVLMGPRNGMPVFGLGLLEAIPQADILALADPQDSNKDGISGRPNWVFDAIKAKAGDPNPVSLGRFGWKANEPSVKVQSLEALRSDIGITNPLFPTESIQGTPMHDDYLVRTGFTDTGVDANGQPEVGEDFTDPLVFYVETLAVPARRNINNPDVREGARLFAELKCTSCHQPKFVTKASGNIGGVTIPDALASQTIYPFTDMLLHDMGPELVDGRPDFLASGSEWRTRPLWGIGLTHTVNPHAGFLHDGRASTVEEAILWHGGEAEKSKNDFTKLTAKERQQLVDFMMSL